MGVNMNLKFFKREREREKGGGIPINSKVQQTKDEWIWFIGYPFNCTGKGAAMKVLVTLVEFLDEAFWVSFLYERSLQNEISKVK